jgi:hypothetical protein
MASSVIDVVDHSNADVSQLRSIISGGACPFANAKIDDDVFDHVGGSSGRRLAIGNGMFVRDEHT